MKDSIHPNTVLGEVHLKVSNLARSIQFYKEVVGLQVLDQTADSARFTVDGHQVLLAIQEVTGAIVPRRSSAGLYHFAILVPDRKTLGLSLRNLIQSGIHIGQADHLVSEALYIADPDNNGIEIYRDRPRESWKRDAQGNYKMATDPIDWDGLLAEAGDESWTGLPTGTIIGHIHLHVSDLQQSKAFYIDVLGFTVELNGAANMGALFIAAGGYHHHIGLNIWAGVGAPLAPAEGTGLAYFTIVVPNQAELQAVIERVSQAGIAVTEANGDWALKDPTGIEIRLVVNK
ncbi:VOC family protein [Paenibacillus sp. FSL H7-0331]|uniref:VOC family protein n=1 Tax=Paenibacillus sp. FSL H7-0331 TaxID=1920421 RepID=UPI00096BFA47|nr:VOC family protein [Paenibacillus sp. FSL H7-0331]OMF04388.1 glyoxalase [Paenibacillus sp. FSL H7-0331]